MPSSTPAGNPWGGQAKAGGGHPRSGTPPSPAESQGRGELGGSAGHGGGSRAPAFLGGGAGQSAGLKEKLPGARAPMRRSRRRRRRSRGASSPRGAGHAGCPPPTPFFESRSRKDRPASRGPRLFVGISPLFPVPNGDLPSPKPGPGSASAEDPRGPPRGDRPRRGERRRGSSRGARQRAVAAGAGRPALPRLPGVPRRRRRASHSGQLRSLAGARASASGAPPPPLRRRRPRDPPCAGWAGAGAEQAGQSGPVPKRGAGRELREAGATGGQCGAERGADRSGAGSQRRSSRQPRLRGAPARRRGGTARSERQLPEPPPAPPASAPAGTGMSSSPLKERRSPVGLDRCSCCLDLAGGPRGYDGNWRPLLRLREQLACESLGAASELRRLMRQGSLEPVLRDPRYLLSRGICTRNVDQTLLSILLFFHSASGASVVAIDNKIEQAMDLVKNHLMFAVREEVEVLKEQIKELAEKNSRLERENSLLKNLASPEQLQRFRSHLPLEAPPVASREEKGPRAAARAQHRAGSAV